MMRQIKIFSYCLYCWKLYTFQVVACTQASLLFLDCILQFLGVSLNHNLIIMRYLKTDFVSHINDLP